MGALALLLLAGCVSPVAPDEPRLERPGLYASVVACSGLPARPEPPVYLLPADPVTGGFECASEPGCLGIWTTDGIYVADSPRGRSDFTVRHEMLHHLLEGDPAHASPTWAACDLEPGDAPVVLVLR